MTLAYAPLAYSLLAAFDGDESEDIPSTRRLRETDVAPTPAAVTADAELVERIRLGDPAAFEAMYREHWAALTGFARALVRHEDVATELVSDVFAGIWHRRETWRPLTIRSYLFGAIRNRAINVRRNAVRADIALAYVTPGEALGMGVPPDPPDAALIRNDRLHAVHRALLALTEPQRTLLILRWQRQLRWDEIAHVLGVSSLAVQQQHSRLLKSLRTTVDASLNA